MCLKSIKRHKVFGIPPCTVLGRFRFVCLFVCVFVCLLVGWFVWKHPKYDQHLVVEIILHIFCYYLY